MAGVQSIKGSECHGRRLAQRPGRRQGGQDADAGLGMGLALTSSDLPMASWCTVALHHG
jgi:hypothetical protein